MGSYTLSQWILFFLFYCFAGWCIETTFVSVRKRQFVNRGFLNGPVIPIYGSGAIAILFVTLPVRQHLVAVFFFGRDLPRYECDYIFWFGVEADKETTWWI